ncbi:hypothetical protein Asppvi_010948 [Aspergillus pseudoviridinutans]|uniref:chitinase n=1 Tax=Aspergillus pseudoviridinutans TaxID=1517512 RepID=A0A9P3F0G4_9EURO|nr:uncharacterized protein Asppvi_010948 [Aspergillus pseudoviridinutans]GIJ91973.1 hypothetical protein Asppvi_010948 [Aspergillus pseudoviridinutans]
MNGVLFFWLCLVSWLHLATAQDYTCSATKPCAIGCCSNTGVCGLGPDFCGASCISNCDRKSDCNPGWGMQWSQADKCPLNVCCSKFGFCGTTEDFCGNKTVQSPQCSSGSSSSKRTVGYYEAWSITRSCDRMYPESLPIGSYTHLNFAFAFIDPSSFKVAPMNAGDEALYKRFTGLKSLYPDLETWISIGGWSMNDPDQPTATTFSDLAGSADAQAKFFDSLISFMETYGFDGVDIDWEYPVAEERSGKPADYQNYPAFLRNLRNALSSTGHKYGLSITIPSSYWYLQHFDIVEIEKTIDWFNMMSYDLHGTWDSSNRYTGPYLKSHTNLTEIDQALELLWRNDINPDHVVLGLGFYGRSFTLTDPACSKPGCTFSSGGNAGPCTAAVGTLSYAEIERVIAGGAKVELDTDAAVKIVTWGGNQWVSYDDADTLKLKLDYSNKHCLGGTMVWAASTDDAQGSAAAALSKLTGRSIISLAATSSSADQVQSCQLGECGKQCPNGLKPAQRSDGKNKGNTGTNTGCPSGQSRLYCCPPDNMPTCQWRGGAPFCNGKCHDGEVEVSSSLSGTGSECWTGHKVLCCTQNAANAAVAECKWYGSAPFCAAPFSKASCPTGRQSLTYSNYGAGGEEPCITGYKSFCCDQPPPYENCDWYYHGGKILGQIPFQCTGECPAGKASIATDPSGCLSGYGSFCCSSPSTTNDPQVAAFTAQLEKFVKNPVCKASDRQYTKRDGGERTVALAKRHDLAPSDWSALMLQITALAIGRAGTYQSSLMAGQFNTTYGEPFGLSLDQIHRSFDDAPLVDTNSRTESLMCMGRNAGNEVDDYERSRSSVCVLPCAAAGAKRRGVDASLSESNGTKLLLNRNIGESEESQSSAQFGLPTWGYIVDGIVNGHMTLVYEQLINTNAGENILEIVWEVPDDSYRETAADRWVVFHFHFEHLANRGGVNRPGIYAIVAFHAQQYANSNRYSRVDGNGHNTDNRRAHILQCNTGSQATANTIYWYPGDLPNSATSNLPVWAQVLTRFGNYLFDEDLVTEETFTGAQRGQLTTFTHETDPCSSRRYFDWGGYRQSRQFTPNGNAQGQPSTEDSQDDNDEV